MEEIKNNFDKYYEKAIYKNYSGKSEEVKKEILRFLIKEGTKGLTFQEMIDILEACKSSLYQFVPTIIET